MGYANCGRDKLGRFIGYDQQATCDYEGCKREIDRGMGCACGHDHGEGEYSCDKYYCGKHLFLGWHNGAMRFLCRACWDLIREEENGKEGK